MRNYIVPAVTSSILAMWMAEHAVAQESDRIDPRIINAHAQALCLVPVKIPNDGSSVTLESVSASELAGLSPPMNVGERVAPLFGPFRAGDPLSAPALPSLQPIPRNGDDSANARKSAEGGATLETSSDNSRAALVYNAASSSGGGALALSSIEISAPLSKEGDTSIHRMGEFASDARLKISRTWFSRAWADVKGVPDLSEVRRKVWEGVKNKVAEQCSGKPEADSQECRDKLELTRRMTPEHILLRTDCVNQYATKPDYDRYVDLYFPPQASFFAGLTASVGYLDFKFTNPSTFENEKTNETAWGAGVFFGGYTADRRNLFRVGYDYVRGYKAASDSIVCRVPDPAMPPQCQSGKFAGPGDDDGDVGFAEMRRTLAWKFFQAFTVKYSYDFDARKSEVDVPLYLFRNKKGDLNGGVRVDWNEKDDFGIGVFVGTAFSTDFQ